MYQIKVNRNSKVYQANTVAGLVSQFTFDDNASLSKVGGNKHPARTASGEVKKMIEYGIMSPVSGPNWFMALQPADEIYEAGFGDEEEVNTDEIIAEYAAKLGIPFSTLELASRKFANDKNSIKFSTVEKEALFNEFIKKLWG